MGLYFLKYTLAYGALFFLVPCFIFTNIKPDLVKGLAANYIKMTFWVIIFGYITVLLRLFEFITFFAIVLIAIAYKYYKKSLTAGKNRGYIGDDVGVLVINHVDRVERIENKLLKYIVKTLRAMGSDISDYFGNPWLFLGFLMLCAIFGYAGYLHFHDAFTSVAPEAGESYLTMVRMKSLGSRVLFTDNIYPQGFYLVLETLQRMMRMDHLFIVRFTGAFHTLITGFGMYFFVSRLTKSQTGGMAAALIYCVLGISYAQNAWLRNTATPLQFAMIFVLPVLFFFYEYIRRSRREDFFAAFFGAMVIGLVHPSAFVFLAIGLVTLCAACLIRGASGIFHKLLEVIAFVVMATVISMMPVGIGLLMGKGFDGGMIEYLFATDYTIKAPSLNLFDYAAMAAMVLIALRALVNIRNQSRFISHLWVLMLGAVCLGGYLYAGAVTKSVYINDGARMIWMLMLPVVVAFGAEAVFAGLRLLPYMYYAGYFIGIAALITVFGFFPQQPITAQKQEYDSTVAQYLRITKTFRPTQWMIVSWQEEYALSLSNGFHMMTDDFLNRYSPHEQVLVDRTGNEPEKLEMQDVLIFCEKRAYKFPGQSSDQLQYRGDTGRRVKEWLVIYQEKHDNLTLFYSDRNLEIWRIHYEMSDEERIERLWQ